MRSERYPTKDNLLTVKHSSGRRDVRSSGLGPELTSPPQILEDLLQAPHPFLYHGDPASGRHTHATLPAAHQRTLYLPQRQHQLPLPPHHQTPQQHHQTNQPNFTRIYHRTQRNPAHILPNTERRPNLPLFNQSPILQQHLARLSRPRVNCYGPQVRSSDLERKPRISSSFLNLPWFDGSEQTSDQPEPDPTSQSFRSPSEFTSMSQDLIKRRRCMERPNPYIVPHFTRYRDSPHEPNVDTPMNRTEEQPLAFYPTQYGNGSPWPTQVQHGRGSRTATIATSLSNRNVYPQHHPTRRAPGVRSDNLVFINSQEPNRDSPEEVVVYPTRGSPIHFPDNQIVQRAENPEEEQHVQQNLVNYPIGQNYTNLSDQGLTSIVDQPLNHLAYIENLTGELLALHSRISRNYSYGDLVSPNPDGTLHPFLPESLIMQQQLTNMQRNDTVPEDSFTSSTEVLPRSGYAAPGLYSYEVSVITKIKRISVPPNVAFPYFNRSVHPAGLPHSSDRVSGVLPASSERTSFSEDSEEEIIDPGVELPMDLSVASREESRSRESLNLQPHLMKHDPSTTQRVSVISNQSNLPNSQQEERQRRLGRGGGSRPN